MSKTQKDGELTVVVHTLCIAFDSTKKKARNPTAFPYWMAPVFIGDAKVLD